MSGYHSSTYDQGLATGTFNQMLPTSIFRGVPDLPPLHLWHLFLFKVFLQTSFSLYRCKFTSNKNFIPVATAAQLLGNLCYGIGNYKLHPHLPDMTTRSTSQNPAIAHYFSKKSVFRISLPHLLGSVSPNITQIYVWLPLINY